MNKLEQIENKLEALMAVKDDWATEGATTLVHKPTNTRLGIGSINHRISVYRGIDNIELSPEASKRLHPKLQEILNVSSFNDRLYDDILAKLNGKEEL